MGTFLPIVPESLAALLPRRAQCVAMVAREQAKRVGKSGGDVWLSYRHLGNVLGLRIRKQIENVAQDYRTAILAILEAA